MIECIRNTARKTLTNADHICHMSDAKLTDAEHQNGGISMYEMNIVKVLSSLPADDGNFKSALVEASTNQLEIAIQMMEEKGGHNKTRLNACRKALKKKEKANLNKEYKVVYDRKGYTIEVGQNGWIPDKEIAEKILKKKQGQSLYRDKKLYLEERDAKSVPTACQKYNGKRVLNEDLMYFDALEIGDLVEDVIIENGRNTLPPACDRSDCIQFGEAYSTRIDDDGKWKTTYLTFKKVTDGIWEFCGDCFRGENAQTGERPAVI